MTTKQKHCEWLDTQDFAEPDYHEQIAVMQEMEEQRKAALKQEGAIDALQRLAITLSRLCLRDDVKDDYYFGMHDALQVVKSNLDVAKGGIA